MDIKIEILGQVGSGKSTICEIIEKALREKGFENIAVNDEDLVKAVRERYYDQRVEALSKKINVLIESKQTCAYQQ